MFTGEGDGLRVALMRSGHGTWVFPKGRIEDGESPAQAAVREVGEEIGMHATELVVDLGHTEHTFERAGHTYRKRVDWFLLRAASGTELRADPQENALDCGWFAPKQALSLLSHSDQRRVLRRAAALLGK